MYQWSLSSETKLPLYTSCLIVCIWLDRHLLEMDAMRKTHNVRAAELSEQVIQLQVKLPFMCLTFCSFTCTAHKGLAAVGSAFTQSSSSHMPVPGMSCESHLVMLCRSMSSVTPLTASVRGTWKKPSVCQVSLAEASRKPHLLHCKSQLMHCSMQFVHCIVPHVPSSS